MKYYPEFFNPKNFKDAQSIILGMNDTNLKTRWKEETNWIKDLLHSFRNIDKNSIVLDFGTGVGRIAKVLIEKFKCTVYGCDISKDMLDYAVDYVKSDKFHPILYKELPDFKGFFTNVTAIWALQHVENSQEVISTIVEASKSKSYLFLIDLKFKSVPSKDGKKFVWATDQIPTNKIILEKYYSPVTMGSIPESLYKNNPDNILNNSWWANLLKND